MLKIDMDNGTRYTFEDYDNYEITSGYLVVEKGEAWIGAFRIEHLVGFFVD